jgi:hypothetical protein
MVIGFATLKIEKAVNDASSDDMLEIDRIIRRKKAPCTSEEIIETLDALAAAETLYDLPTAPFHPHPLSGDKKGMFSVWINKKTRIIFRPDHAEDSAFRIDNPKTIKRIVVEELCIDYHGH